VTGRSELIAGESGGKCLIEQISFQDKFSTTGCVGKEGT